MAVTKSQLTKQLQRIRHKRALNEVTVPVNAILKKCLLHLEQGGRIEIRGFGNFCLHYRNSRERWDPRNGDAVHIPARYAVQFRASKLLLEKINGAAMEAQDK